MSGLRHYFATHRQLPLLPKCDPACLDGKTMLVIRPQQLVGPIHLHRAACLDVARSRLRDFLSSPSVCFKARFVAIENALIHILVTEEIALSGTGYVPSMR